MKKNLILFLFLVSLSSADSISQVNDSPIEYRFKNGYDGFSKFMFQNAIFPRYSKERNTIGLSISKMSITPLGKIGEIKIINPIDNDIDEMVKDLLKKTAFGWQKCDSISSNQTFYIQIAFNLIGAQQDFFDKSIFPSNKMFLKPIVVTTSPINRLPENKESLTKQCVESIKSGKFKKALSAVNELIRRYPYSKDLYQLRMSIAQKLNDKKLIDQDLQKISNFADGLSLDKLFE
jgi:hypothetical protein